jgi:hypothetical protein
MSESTNAAPAAVAGVPASAPAPVTPPVAAPSSIDEASAELRKATSWDDIATGGMGVTDGEDAGETPAVEAPASDAAPDVDGEFVQGADGRWHRADGTFANEAELAAITAELAAPSTETPAVEAPKAETVTLRMRNGETRDVEIDDADLAQEIRQNFNDGMRKRDYDAKKAEVETMASEYREFRAMLAKNPEGVILQHLPAEKQVSIAAQLLAQHFDALIPIIQGYDANPSSRLQAVTEAQRAAREQEGEYSAFVVSQRQAAEVKSAVAALIPDTIADDVQDKFWKFASMELTAAVDAGKTVNKDTVPTLLADLMSHYGFTGAAPAAPKKLSITAVAPKAAVSASSPAATPANDAAKQLADAQAAQRRIKLTQRARTNAAAVPPVGAGAAPVRLPPVPKGATLEEAAAIQRKQRSWQS